MADNSRGPTFTALYDAERWRRKLEAAGFKVLADVWPAPAVPAVLSPLLQGAMPARYAP